MKLNNVTENQEKVINKYAEAIAWEMALKPEMIFKGHTRTKCIVRARQALIYFIKNDFRTSRITLSNIGKLFEMPNDSIKRKKPYMDHSNVVHAYQRAAEALKPNRFGVYPNSALRSIILSSLETYRQHTGDWKPINKNESLWIREKNIKDRIEFLKTELDQIFIQKKAFYENN